MTRPFEKEQLRLWSEEKSVRGEVVRLAMHRMDNCDHEHRQVVEEAMVLLLQAFENPQGDRS